MTPIGRPTRRHDPAGRQAIRSPSWPGYSERTIRLPSSVAATRASAPNRRMLHRALHRTIGATPRRASRSTRPMHPRAGKVMHRARTMRIRTKHARITSIRITRILRRTILTAGARTPRCRRKCRSRLTIRASIRTAGFKMADSTTTGCRMAATPTIIMRTMFRSSRTKTRCTMTRPAHAGAVVLSPRSR